MGFWTPPKFLFAGETQTLTLSLWQLAPLKFPYSLPSEGVANPSEAWASFSGQEQGAQISGDIPCKSQEAAFVCNLPAARLDVLVHLRGFASEPFWDLELAPNRTLSVPRRTLRPGASVVGFVTDERGSPTRAQVELKPLERAESIGSSKLEKWQKVFTGPKGFFQFSSVLPGVYRVEAHGKGLQASLGPVTVERNKETALSRPLTLAPPASLEVTVLPPTMPQGNPWKLIMVSSEGSDGAFKEQTVPPHGHLRIEALAPGSYAILLVSSQNDREVWAQRVVSVPEQSLTLLDLPVVRVAGRVKEGDNPVPALVAFGGMSGPVKVVLEANDEGYFEGFLPRPGSWHVAVAPKRQNRMVWDTEVDVAPQRGKNPSWVDLSLQSSRVSGWVRDPHGSPQGGAVVEVSPLEHPGMPYPGARTAEDGRFSASAPPGRVLLRARYQRWASPPVEVTLKAEEALQGVELVLAEQNVVEGQIVGTAGSTQAIPVDAHVLWPAASPPRGRTDNQSRFRFVLDPGMRSVTVVAFPRLGNLAIGCTEIPASASLQIPVSSVPGGTVEVLDGAKVTGWVDVVARYHGCPFFLSALHDWARYVGTNPIRGGNWVFPQLPPGVWELCSYRWSGLAAVLGPCHAGVLPPGGTLLLKLPNP
ncbi:hypothetical protein HRbin09_01928 [bacterium HR09]|nr:hypothetical protein HRbin09_01928 [bacterium HR09]